MAKSIPKPAAKKPAPSVPLRNNIFLLGAIVAGAAFLLYANTLGHGYALDDVAVIYENNFVKRGISGIPDIFTTFYWAGYWDQNAGLYRPLSLVMFAVEWELFPSQPFIGHFVNVLLYAASCYLLFRVLLLMFRNLPPVFSFAVALLFALHPVHTEVVANIKSRDEILSLLFFLLSVQQLFKHLQTEKKTSLACAVIFFFLSLLSKEGAILFLFIYPLILYFFSSVSLRRTGRLVLPFLAVAVVWFGLHEWVISLAPLDRKEYTYADNSLVAAPDLMSRFATAFSIMGRYLKLLFYPHPLSYDYSYSQVPNISWTRPAAFIPLIICAGLLVIAIRQFRQRTPLSFGILFFFITIALTSNIFVLIGATMADRFLFVPSVGFCIVAVWLLYDLRKKQPVSAAFFWLTPVFMLYSYKTITRNNDWKNDETLFLHDVSSAPNSSRVHYNAATAMLGDALQENDANRKAKLLDETIEELETSLKLDSNYSLAWTNYGVALYHRKLYDRSVLASRKVLALEPENVTIYSNLADAYFMANQYDSAIVYFNRSIEAGQTYKDTYNRLGSAYFSRQEFGKAIDAYLGGIAKDSTYADLWMNLGSAYGAMGQFPQANAAFEKAYNLNPANPQPLYYIAMTWQNIGDTAKAGEYLRRYNSATGGK